MNRPSSLFAVYNNPAFSEFGKPCDGNLKTENGTEFQVYIEPLTRQCEFFKALFSFDRTFGQSSVIHGIQPGILKRILIYLYTGHINLRAGSIMNFFVASDFLLIDSLKRKCHTFLLKTKNYNNSVELLLTAYRMNASDLVNKWQRSLLLCFENAIKLSKNKAYDIPYESVVYFLSNKSINVTGERFIWSFIEEWVQKNPSNGMQRVPELLRFLSLNEIDQQLLSDIISSPIIQENELYKNLKDSMAASDENSNHILRYCNGFPFINGVRLPPCLYFVINNNIRYAGGSMFITYDEDLDVWRRLGKISFKVRKLLRIEHRVYMFDSSGYSASIYDLFTGNLLCISPISYIAQYIEVAGHIYAVRNRNSGVIYRYVIETDDWIYTTSIHITVTVVDTLSLNGLIYVIGTIEEGRMIMQVYDPSLSRWSTVAPPNIRRIHAESVVYQGKIFFIGGSGWTLNIRGKDVEVYDPVEDKWVVYPELPFYYSSISSKIEVVKGLLCVFNRPLVYERSREGQQWLVAYWDGSSTEWKLCNDPSSVLFKTSFCTIEGDVVREIMKMNKDVAMKKWKKTSLEETED